MAESLTYTVTPDDYFALQDLAAQATRIDGSFDEGAWLNGLSALFGKEIALSWIGQTVQIVVSSE